MKYKTLAWLPVAALLPFFLGELVVGQSHTLSALVAVEVGVAKAAWLFGCLAAAFTFEKGDYLRRGWLLTGLSSAVYILRDVTFIPALHDAIPPGPLDVYCGIVIIIGNIVQVSGAWVLARAWSVSGIEDTRYAKRSTPLHLTAVVVALAICGGSIVGDAKRVLSGEFAAWVYLASDLGDAACFILVGPLLRTALALRGGVLAWTWALYTTSLVAWMFYDGVHGITTSLGVQDRAAPVFELFHSLGAAYFCVAGLAQRRVVSEPVAGES